MKILLFFILFYLFSFSISYDEVIPLGYESHNDSLVIRYREIENYYTNISFLWKGKSRYDMSFNCVLNNTIRTCTLPVKESDHAQMYSEEISACTENNGTFKMCGYDLPLFYFPSPLLISEFKPKTRGGNTTLSGYYLELKERIYVQFENSYRKDQFFYSGYVYLIPGVFQSKTPDRINLILKVYPGCGYRTIIWENHETLNFTYQEPNIEKIDINQSFLDITGTNFYNQSIFVSVKIDNNIIDPNDIISVDFEIIKLKFNYSDPFSSKFNVQVGCCDYWSSQFQITYPPIPSIVNSIPKLKGGLLIINGNRLTSSPSSSNNNNISVTVGDSICSIVSSSSNEIKCNLQPLSNSTFNNSSPIAVSINDVVNTNTLLLIYDTPYITTFSQVNDEIHIIGGCFGNINSTQIHINDKQVFGQIKSINNDETDLILKIQNQIYNFNISIESNSIKSNGINVDVEMYARINEIPLVSNKLINFTLFYVNSSNINLIPTIKIINEKSNQTSKSISTNVNESVVSCSFLIENNCGIINYEIEIGNQIYQSSFSYESPLINKCNLNSNEIVTCIGKGFVNKYNETSIFISGQSIALSKEINNSIYESISFQMNDEYNILGELYLNVCGLLSNKVNINTFPIFKNVSIPNLFDTNGGNIIIIGKYLNNNTNFTIECNGEQIIEKECKLNNSSTSLECYIKLNGPNGKTCKLLFNNDNNIVSTFSFIYKSPSINQTSIINLKQGGILTIIGNDFYYPIDKVTIIGNGNGSGNSSLNCNEAKYINDTMITCFIQATNYTFNNIKNGEMIFINVSTNGKSGISKVFKYLTQSDDVHQYSDARNIFQNLLLSILIIIIISLFISNI
ncbi:immunoglobulin E-set domain-containing protein [Dictyostelium discoideum AX4]|uniref:Tiger protein I3 n=1 Tax=Dictyostelium discoideum TaxID=44689 RepID=TGRI3_DICDI|nr:immunoglobulin E-set domain-containing protein [Dictyostelium discoideum AX4]Q54RE1.2 RecName: Full=Tiger protein I3; AltName: Full=Transmembrane, IPT, Ig, E-set, Repeat protein I3; Flags: Precursor [Dictyostelium discoideum]EAL65863.2 immunoglobulin E-set domain-containing protein [Dictyostelium discoideum AX4]|eukprot:XP_639204.2 immunoglobulin E-set domain-containing protein [Dictyostelium discoideum AX4]